MYRIYLYKFLIDFWVIVPVLVPFYRMHGMSMTRILTVQAVFSLSQLLFEIPSGYLSDVIGRKKTLVLAALLMLCGIALYTWFEGFWWFVVAEAVLGCAGALRSGTDSAILYDHLKSVKDEHRYRSCEGTAEFWSRTGTAVSAVAGGVLGAYATLRLPFYVNMGSALAMVFVGLSLHEPAREKHPVGNPLRNIMKVAFSSVTRYELFSAMVRMGMLFSTGVTAVWGYFILYKKYELPLFWHGILFAAMQQASAFGAKTGLKVESRIGWRAASLLPLVPGVLFVLIGTIHSISAVISIVMLHAVVWGVTTPLLLERIQRHTTSDVRATTLSVGSMIGRILNMCWGPLFGWIVDHGSCGTAFVWMGIFFYAGNLAVMAFRRNGGGEGTAD